MPSSFIWFYLPNNNYTDQTDELIYYMVKIPTVFEFMREKRFRRPAEDTANGRNILYSGARLSTDYAELYSYVAFCQLSGSDNEYHYGRGYLDSSTTIAYIEKVNGKSTHIAYDYSQKLFCDENRRPLFDSSRNFIKTVDDLLASI